MKKILVTGSNGLLGQKVIEILTGLKTVGAIATSLNVDKIVDVKGYDFELLDLTNHVETGYIIRIHNPDIIINTAAMTQVDKCEEQKAECWKINVEALKNLVKCSNDVKAQLIHLSSDFVFDGTGGPYTENDIPNPLSYYGLSKWEGEKIIKDRADKWTIVRTILVYGVNRTTRSNIVLWVKNSLEAGKPIQVVNDQFRAPTLVDDLANACIEMGVREKTGIFHISGPEMMSIVDIAYKVAGYYKLDTSLITPISSAELNEIAQRPRSTGFVLDKAKKELNYLPHPFEDGLKIY
ncbi:MAG: SDR family oxidoreductase [Bacteroidales bacterium]|nr:SDR family oxidoreductase [Bacteroidales bacterium]